MQMNLSDWLPALTTNGLFAIALWLTRNIIVTRLTRSVEHEFNSKLETVKAELRESEERFKSELRAKESEITAIRSGTLTAQASRQIALDKRRIEAIDQLLESVRLLGPSRSIAFMMTSISFDKAAKITATDPNARKAFEMMGNNFRVDDINIHLSLKARPYLTPMVWATFSALHAVIIHGVTRWMCLKSGTGNNDLLDEVAINKLVTAALPHYSDYLNKYGVSAYSYLINALEEKLNSEIQNMLSGTESDKANIEQAAEIVRQANAIRQEATTSGVKLE